MERGRYITIYYKYYRLLSLEELKRLFSKMGNYLYGIQGSLDLGLYISWLHESEPIAILRCSHSSIDKIFNILYFISYLEDRLINLIPIDVSGTIKNSKEILSNEYLNRLKAKLSF